MIVLNSNTDLFNWQQKTLSKSVEIGFVPTMGALHSGHLALIERAVKENNVTVVSLYVNPTQFNNVEDLEKYPRNLDADLELLSGIPNLVVFIPKDIDIYPTLDERRPPVVDLGKIGEVMEAVNRPGHFEGVLTVVKRFFELVNPNRAYFGLKDYQQFLVVSKLAEQHFKNITIVPCEIVRSQKGLALSSRNQRLSKMGIVEAENIIRYLSSFNLIDSDSSLTKKIKEIELSILNNPNMSLEYLEVLSSKNLEQFSFSDSVTGRVFIAVWIENVRLIDNVELSLN